MIRIRRKAVQTDARYHVYRGEKEWTGSSDPDACPEVRLRLPAGLQAVFELIHPDSMTGTGIVRYKAGDSRWFSLAIPLDALPPECAPGGSGSGKGSPSGKIFWAMALRNVSGYLPEGFRILEAIAEIRDGKCRDADAGAGGDPVAYERDPDGFCWIPGDFHQHSDDSDGADSPAALQRMNGEAGLGFWALTDHQVSHPGNVGAFPLRLGGLELTFPGGHLNAIGLERWTGLLWSGLPDETFGDLPWIRRMADSWRQSGAVIQINHPAFAPWQWKMGGLDGNWFDAIEVICDPGHPDSADASEEALVLWNRMLDEGRPAAGTGGSDFHGPPGRPGWPQTFCGSRRAVPDREGLLEAVREGRTSVGCGYRPILQAMADESGTRLTWRAAIRLCPAGAPAGTESPFPIRASLTVCSRKAAEMAFAEEGRSAWQSLPLPPEWMPTAGTGLWARLDCRDARGRLTGFTMPVRMPRTDLCDGPHCGDG